MSSTAFGATGAIAALPSGVMIDFAGTTAPGGWLMCDGAAVSRTVYAALFTAIGTAYGTGDGSTTFNLPDYRGRFPRYMDNMGTVAGAASRDTGRVLGAAQADAMQGHKHSVTDPGHGHTAQGQLASLTAGAVSTSLYNVSGTINYTSGDRIVSNTTGLTVQNPSTDGSNGAPRTGAETRPINLSCNRIIKF